MLCALRILLQQPIGQFRFQNDDRECVAEDIVQIARNPFALRRLENLP